MRHSVFGRKFSRTKNERKRLFAGLAREMLLRGAIRTTVAKAKAVQPLVEKLVTKAKAGTDADRRRISRTITDAKAVDGLLSDAKTRFANRTSGFTRIVRLGIRGGDAAEEALLQFVDERVVAEVIPPKEEKKPVKKITAKAPVKSREGGSRSARRGRPKKISK